MHLSTSLSHLAVVIASSNFTLAIDGVLNCDGRISDLRAFLVLGKTPFHVGMVYDIGQYSRYHKYTTNCVHGFDDRLFENDRCPFGDRALYSK